MVLKEEHFSKVVESAKARLEGEHPFHFTFKGAEPFEVRLSSAHIGLLDESVLRKLAEDRGLADKADSAAASVEDAREAEDARTRVFSEELLRQAMYRQLILGLAKRRYTGFDAKFDHSTVNDALEAVVEAHPLKVEGFNWGSVDVESPAIDFLNKLVSGKPSLESFYKELRSGKSG